MGDREHTRRGLLRSLGAGVTAGGLTDAMGDGVRKVRAQPGRSVQNGAEVGDQNREPGTSGPVENARARWRRALGDDAGNPVVEDGRVYVQTGDQAVALDAADGTQRWSATTAFVDDGSPALLGDRVVIANEGGGLRAVDAATGADVWRYDDDRVSAGVTAADGRVYAVLDEAVVALTADGTRQWRTPVGGDGRLLPTVADGRVFVLTGGSQRVLHALDAADGSEQWTARTDEYPESLAASPDGSTVYLNLGYEGVRAFRASDGTERWTSEEQVGDSLIVTDAKLYGEEGILDAATGEQVQRLNIGTWSPATATMADGIIYVGNAGGRVIGYDPESETELWRYYTGAGAGRGTIAVADGTLFVATDDGTLYALESAPGLQPPNVSLSVDGNVVKRESGYGDDDYGELRVETGAELTFDASGSSDPDGAIERYEWFGLDDSSGSDSGPNTDPILTHTFSEVPSETNHVEAIQLVVTDGDGATSGREIMVSNTVQVSIEPEPSQPQAGEQVTFTAETDSIRSIETYRWDFGDDGTVDIETDRTTVDWRFSESGEHSVSLTGVDTSGATATVTEDIQVSDGSGGGGTSDGGTAGGGSDGDGGTSGGGSGGDGGTAGGGSDGDGGTAGGGSDGDGGISGGGSTGSGEYGASTTGTTAPQDGTGDTMEEATTDDAEAPAAGVDEDADQFPVSTPGLVAGGLVTAGGVGGWLYRRSAGSADEADGETPSEGPGGEPPADEATSDPQTATESGADGSSGPVGVPETAAAGFAAACEPVRNCRAVDDSGPVHVYDGQFVDDVGETDARIYALAPEHADDVGSAFADAARGWQSISKNTHIATVFDSGEEPRPWVAFERGEGRLDALLDGLDLDDRVDVLVDLAEAVRTGSMYNRVHGRIAPDVVYLTEDDQNGTTATLADWGLQRTVLERIDDPPVTPYTAPEQLDHESPTTQTDVYQLGAVAYRVLTGEPPFADGSGLRASIGDGEVTPPTEVDPALPAAVDDVIERAMATDPDRRFPSPYDFRQQLIVAMR